MSNASNIGKAMRMAGQQLGKKVALETAVGTALGQAVPRMIGGTPAQGPLQSAKKIALESAIGNAAGMGLTAMGVPKVISGPVGAATGMVGGHFITRPRAIDPEPNDQLHTSGSEMQYLQHFQAAQEQQRYNNEINLALAKNYHAPVTTVVHRNPSAEFETVRNMLNPSVRY